MHGEADCQHAAVLPTRSTKHQQPNKRSAANRGISISRLRATHVDAEGRRLGIHKVDMNKTKPHINQTKPRMRPAVTLSTKLLDAAPPLFADAFVLNGGMWEVDICSSTCTHYSLARRKGAGEGGKFGTNAYLALVIIDGASNLLWATALTNLEASETLGAFRQWTEENNCVPKGIVIKHFSLHSSCPITSFMALLHILVDLADWVPPKVCS